MNNFDLKVESVTDSSRVLKYGILRISVLTSRLIRVENWVYRDEPTQRVWFRNFDNPEFTVEKKGPKIIIHTIDCQFTVSPTGRVKATLKGGKRLSTKGNLWGTARTLDMTNGRVILDKGLISKGGLAVLDDSDGLILDGNAIHPRTLAIDRYYFAYGNDYRGAMKAFYALTGRVPLIPKYALGNWWSRYHDYTQDEYIALIKQFQNKNIPLTVATIDMDWHWVEVEDKFGKEVHNIHTLSLMDKIYAKFLPGWTGYSWNTDLFPDHVAMLEWLKQQGLKVPLNTHPSQGIRFFEDNYAKACEIVGIDPNSKKPVIFDLSNPLFVKAYFETAHHPLEDEGVDFWWIDWQQGRKSQTKGLDPLWALNHYHYSDASRNGLRPLILSRYAGLGSHRYPLGFSGDTKVTWKALAFQPYFTANSANAGYTWWSHDIGGHVSGYKDDELYIRWLQFGVFSPINRLHSSNNEFVGKEPWKCSRYVEGIATTYLRLRHRLIPYLYSANYVTHKDGVAICEPLYYAFKDKEAYKHPNEYIFGGKLICAPITRKADKVTKLTGVDVWLPEKIRYTDVFTGMSYMGGKTIRMYRDLESFPCLAEEGTIIPMYRDGNNNSLAIEKPLEIWIYRGRGSYSLYEDDGESMQYENGNYSISELSVNKSANGFVFNYKQSVSGEMKIAERELTYVFKDIVSATVMVNGIEVNSETTDCVTVTAKGDVIIELSDCVYPESRDKYEQKVEMISKYQMNQSRKYAIFNSYLKGKKKNPHIRKDVVGPLKEIDELL